MIMGLGSWLMIIQKKPTVGLFYSRVYTSQPDNVICCSLFFICLPFEITKPTKCNWARIHIMFEQHTLPIYCKRYVLNNTSTRWLLAHLTCNLKYLPGWHKIDKVRHEGARENLFSLGEVVWIESRAADQRDSEQKRQLLSLDTTVPLKQWWNKF